MTEEWRRIDGFPGYEVSDLGRVRSFRPRSGKGPAPTTPRILKMPPKDTGYPHVSMQGPDGRQRTRKVHRLVAVAFLPNPDSLPQVAHRNGNPLDNRAANLRWSTACDNMADTVTHGTKVFGERVGNSKLTEDDVMAIRGIYSLGDVTQQEIAERYGVDRATISYIVNGHSWGHLPDAVRGETYKHVA